MTEPTNLRIVDVDPSDPAGFEPFYEVYAAALRHGPQGEYATVWQPHEVRVAMEDPDERVFRIGWAGWVAEPDVGSRVVATGWMQASTVDNTDLASVMICCAPSDRGHGYAAAMLAHVEDQARARGRERLVAEVTWPYEAGADGTGSDELAWARRQGFELGLVDVQRRLPLPVPDELLDALAAESAAHHEGYELRSFTGPIPEELAEGWVALDASLMTEAPMGDIEREPETADVSKLRADEAMTAKQGRVKVNTGALAPPDDSGERELVAYTDIAVTLQESERAYQWGTLVRTDYRGHRLGLAVKVANVRLLQKTHPQITTVVTYNADVNAPMVAVNERLGYRPVQWLGELQKRI
jgi:GNAT superfamily N-acetyltransferase/RimJ/RimL family protein N-acetyltransferase